MVDATITHDLSSPFYLGAGDQPGNTITHVVLKNDNYLAWSRAITLSLKSRRKFGFVDGTISKPTDKTKLLDWETVNSMLVSWILRTVDSRLAAAFPYFDEASKLWSYLERRFCDANGPRLQQLRAAITNCRQSKTMSVEEYYTTLMGLFDVLNHLKPPHGFECTSCTCNVAEKYARDREDGIFHQFLVGIDDDKYATVKTNLLSQQPPPTIDGAYQAFIQEERSRSIAQTKEKDVAPHVFALPSNRKSSYSASKVDKSKLSCSHCKHSGHDNTGCFLLHGYPDWWLEKYGKKGAAAYSGSAAAARAAAPSSSVATGVAGHGRPATSSGSVAASSAGHGKPAAPAARAHAVGSSVGDTPASLPHDVLSALSTLQPDNIRALFTLRNNQNQDKMSGPTLGEPDWSR